VRLVLGGSTMASCCSSSSSSLAQGFPASLASLQDEDTKECEYGKHGGRHALSTARTQRGVRMANMDEGGQKHALPEDKKQRGGGVNTANMDEGG